VLTARQLAQRLGERTVVLLELAIMLTLSCAVGATFAHARCESDLGHEEKNSQRVYPVRSTSVSGTDGE
jgi:hypothetical protein